MMETNSFKNWQTLEEIVDRTPLKVTPDTSVFEAIALMSQKQRQGCVLVVDGARLLGIITDQDVLNLIVTGVDLSKTEIACVMTQPLISLKCEQNQNILTALSLLRQHRIRHLPVVDNREQLIGLVTQEQIYEAIAPLEGFKEISDCKQLKLELQASEAKLSQILDNAITDLQESERKLRAVFDSTFEFMGLLTPEGIVIDANRTALNIVAANLSDVIGQPFWETLWWVHFPQQQPILRQAIARAASGEFVRMETKHIWADGTLAFVDFSLKPIFDETGTVVMLVPEGRDITDRKQSELQIRKFVSLADSSTEFIGMCDMNFVPFYVNPEGLQLVGLDDASQFSQTPVREFFFPEDQDFILNEFFPRVLREGRAEVEIRFRHFKTGEALWMVYSVCCIKDSNDQLIGLATLSRNITDRKLAEQKIAEQAALIDIATDAILVLDLESRILFWNQAAERLYGWTAAEAHLKTTQELFDTQSSSQIVKGLKMTIEQGLWQEELEQVTKSDQKIMVASRWTLVRDESGQPKSILVVNTDITEKKLIEQQFYHAQRLESIGTLASGIAHDFNNLLTPILTIAQLLPLKFQDIDEQTRQLLTMLEESAKRGANLVKQLLCFSRGTQGKRMIMQLGHLLSELVSVAQSTFPKSINISNEISTKELWLILADSTQIYQVLMNILVNARDAMPNGGHLTISTENRYLDENYARMNLAAHVGYYVMIRICDTGAGIPPEMIERIFDPFFTTKEVGKGTGLGLAIVQGIVKNHGGFVKVYSELGKGTKFEVFLPAVKEAISQPNSENELPRGNGELILIVDDEEIIQQTTKTSLENYNYRTVVASDGIEAITIYAERKNEISLVLIDLMMPNLDGLTAIRTMQIINPQVKIIPTSGLPTSSQKSLPLNIKTFLLKPYTIKELLNLVYLEMRDFSPTSDR